MIAEQDRQIALAISEQIRKLAQPRVRQIILYGSRARGTARADSDYDLLVIEKDPVSVREEVRRLRRALVKQDFPIDVWVMGEQEFEETKNVIGGLAFPAHKYGVVIYENP
jgi:predicted nucleotidyltransferase